MPVPIEQEEWRERIDGDVRSLGERMAGVESGMNALGRNFDKFSHAFEASIERQQEFSKTRWPLVLGVLTLVVIVVGGLAQGYLRDLNRIEADVKSIQSKRTSEADPVQDSRIGDAESEILGIRSNEHEIIMNNSVLASKIEELQHRREQVFDHMIDGHPVRIEKMLNSLDERVLRLESEKMQ